MLKPRVGTVLDEHLKTAKGIDNKCAYGVERDDSIRRHLQHQSQHVRTDQGLPSML
eukprot:jgi/Phyca11/504955/fgenesh2_kg.PHYCAscaffold_10_\